MDLLACWVLFPALLTAFAAGWGAALERLGGQRLPLALLPALGFAGIVVAGQFLTLADATADLTTPLVVAVALAGLVMLAARRPRPAAWGLAATGAVFAVYAAPVVLSGEPTFAGYIRLDDTATWMALTDRVMEHGRNLEGLAPSTYEATLAFNLADGYPIGVFLPLGVVREVVGQDVAWLIAPYMAWLGALLALALWSLARPLAGAPGWRAAVAFVAAQSSLLFGYYLWGGIKEIAAAMLVATIAALAASRMPEPFARRSLIAPAVLCAGLAAVLSGAGLLWALPALALLLALAVRQGPAIRVAGDALVFALLVAALSVPVIANGGSLPPTSSPLTDADARGNLIEPLEPAQVAGIWPAGDFRLDPDAGLLTAILIAAALLAAGATLVVAWRRHDWGVLAYVGGSLAVAALIWALGSPWVDGKALATAAPAIPLAAGLAAAAIAARGWRLAGAGVLALLAGGVLWSNALAFRDLNLAPHERLAELERIGELIAGEGPTLMTEYEPYGARHFLREADAEGVSELRRRVVPLIGGATVAKGESADTDALDPAGLMTYRTLVLRRSPSQSRPPASFRLVWSGESYEAWQREAGALAPAERLPLGEGLRPAAVPDCARVRELAAAAAASGRRLVAARRPNPIAIAAWRLSFPETWRVPGSELPQPTSAGTLAATVSVRRPGEYEVWLGGSLRPRAELRVDGRALGAVRHVLNNSGQYVRLGETALERGDHELELELSGADLHPGSGGDSGSIGPLVLSRAEAADAELVHFESAAAEEICGRAWDWVEIDD